MALAKGRFSMRTNQYYEPVPKKCWVGDHQKICYASREEAEAAALVAEHDYGAPQLGVYKCEYGEHWHLSSHRPQRKFLK